MIEAWLRELSDKGGKGVVNNIDARCLGRAANLLARLSEVEKALAEAERARDYYRDELQG